MRELASVRTNILLTPIEHRTWAARAKERGMSLAEYIRRSVVAADDAPTAAELDELETLTPELTAAAERMHAAVDEAVAQIRNSGDPVRDVTMRRHIADELERDPVLLDPAILDFASAA